jgi:hypothetical protein
MRKTGVGGQLWPLTSPLAAPLYAADGEISFDMNDVPDRCPTAPLAYFVPALILYFIGSLVNAGETPTPVQVHDLPSLLIKNVAVQDCWHGTPVAARNWLGEHLRIHELIGNGYHYGGRMAGLVTPSAGTSTNHTFAVKIPLSAGEGELQRETSQLALLYQPGQVQVTFKPASVLDVVSDGTTASYTVRAALELDPRAEIVLGTGIEHVLHRTVAAPTGFEVQIKGFGRSSSLTGVLPKGGVLTLMELTAAVAGATGASLGGVFLGNEIAAYEFPWFGQKVTRDPRSVLLSMIDQMEHWPDLPTTTDPAASSERSTFPYEDIDANNGNSDPLNSHLIAWLMVMAGRNMRVTDAPTADSDQTYTLDLGSNSFDTGDHLVIARYLKQWAQAKRDDFEAKVKDGGANSLAAYVLGNGWAGAKLRPRGPVDKHYMTADQTAYLPWSLL